MPQKDNMPQSDFTVIFDLDGTLLDTLGDLADAINSTMRALGYPEKSDADVLAAIGNGIRRAIAKVMPHEPDADELDAAQAIFRTEYKKCYLNKTRPYPGVMDMLRELRARRFRVAVLSNKSDEFTTGLTEKHFFGLVDASAGERPGVPLKPSPDAVLAMLKQVGGSPDRAVYVGDSEVDVATARNAGLPCVPVSWGFRSLETLLDSGADPESIAGDADGALEKILAIEESARATDKSTRAADKPARATYKTTRATDKPAHAVQAPHTLYIADLDGTLFGADARPSEYTLGVVNGLTARGVHFTIATARSPATTFQSISRLALNAPIIMMNGALVYDLAARRYLMVERIESGTAASVAAVLHRLGVNGFMYALDGDVMHVYYENLDTEPLRRFHDERARRFNKRFEKVDSFDDVIRAGAKIVYFTLRGFKPGLLPVYEAFKKIAGAGAILCEDNYTSELCFLECFGAGVSKSAAVRFLRTYGGYERVVGFGDNLNDLPLFYECEECYAPENAKRELKAAATAVIGSNARDGVARWLAARFNFTGS